MIIAFSIEYFVNKCKKLKTIIFPFSRLNDTSLNAIALSQCPLQEINISVSDSITPYSLNLLLTRQKNLKVLKAWGLHSGFATEHMRHLIKEMKKKGVLIVYQPHPSESTLETEENESLVFFFVFVFQILFINYIL